MTPRQRRLAIFAAVNIALLGVGWFELVAPQRHDASVVAAHEQTVQNQLAALINSGSQPPAKQPAIHTSDLYTLDTALPSQLDEPDLIFELERLEAASNVQIQSLAPQLAQASASNYTVQPITMALSGTYMHLTGFLRSLRLLVSEHGGHLIANGPLFAVTSVTLNPATGKNETATVGLAAYYYGAVGGATPPAPPTTDTTTTTGG